MLKGNTLKHGQLQEQKDVQEDTSMCSELMIQNKETTSDKEEWAPGKI